MTRAAYEAFERARTSGWSEANLTALAELYIEPPALGARGAE